MALQELRVNKLRTFLSLLGITIGIFCIIAVKTVLDSLENNIQASVSKLGNDIIYVGKWPWMGDGSGGEYPWWKYWQRPVANYNELKQLQEKVPAASYVALVHNGKSSEVVYKDNSAEDVQINAVSWSFDRVQPIDINYGRYFSQSECDNGSPVVVIGERLAKDLFPNVSACVGKEVQILKHNFKVIGVIKEQGQNLGGFEYDKSVVIPYQMARNMYDLENIFADPLLMIKAKDGVPVEELEGELIGEMRAIRKLKPADENNFSINKLSEVNKQLSTMFGAIDMAGIVIGGFSLLVGAFGIANIMFVTVKERTNIIGLKKAIGARRLDILLEFLSESIILCIIGGVFGILMVMLLTLALSKGADFDVQLSWANMLTGVMISAFVGMLAGLIPSISASKLDPVKAIRSLS
jgi:putative ABC transport system permease protein